MRRLSLLLAVLGLVASGCGVLSEAAARVDGTKITQARVEEELDAVRSDERFVQAVQAQGPEIVGTLRRIVLSSLILQVVRQDLADDLDVSVSNRRVDEAIDESAGGREGRARVLDQLNTSLERLREVTRRGLVEQALVDKLGEDVDLSDQIVRDAYRRSRELYEEVHLRQIVTETEEDATAALEQLRDGDDFEDVAEELSTVDETDLGFISQPPAEVRDVPEGEFVGPVPTPSGFAVLQVVERRTRPLAEVRESIEMQLKRGQAAQEYGRLVARRMREADIVVNPKYGKLDTEALDGLDQVLAQTALNPRGAPPPILVTATEA